jgi:GT2 family glycosyltransferase
MPPAASPTPIAVVIATVHRPEDIVRAVASTLASHGPRFEVIVVDQSGGDTPVGVGGGDARVRVVTMPRLGLSAALNRGTSEAASADVVAITGDDCVVDADWLVRIGEAFGADPALAAVFGLVRCAAFDPARGFVPGCAIDADFVARDVRDLNRMTGTTACMAIRTEAWRRLGGFDEMLGVGAPFRSGEDLDFALRALQAGWRVLQTPRVAVEHQTPVLWEDRARVIRRNWYGTGVALAKSLRLAGMPMAVGLSRLVRRWVSGGSGVAATYGVKPDRRSMLLGFTTGFARGLVARIDRRTGMLRSNQTRPVDQRSG